MGFFWGAATVAIIFYCVAKRRRYRRFWREGGFGYHDHSFWHDEGARFGRGHRRRGRFLFGLFRRLDVSPGQEKALIDMAERIRERMDDTLPELRAARKEVAAVLGSEVLDRGALDAAFARSSELIDAMGRDLREAVSSVHELLDPEQRRLLAAWIADGSFGARFRRPYAHAC